MTCMQSVHAGNGLAGYARVVFTYCKITWLAESRDAIFCVSRGRNVIVRRGNALSVEAMMCLSLLCFLYGRRKILRLYLVGSAIWVCGLFVVMMVA